MAVGIPVRGPPGLDEKVKICDGQKDDKKDDDNNLTEKMDETEAEQIVAETETAPEGQAAPLDASNMMDETTQGETRPREQEANSPRPNTKTRVAALHALPEDDDGINLNLLPGVAEQDEDTPITEAEETEAKALELERLKLFAVFDIDPASRWTKVGTTCLRPPAARSQRGS